MSAKADNAEGKGCAVVILLALIGFGVGGFFGWPAGCLVVAALLTAIIVV